MLCFDESVDMAVDCKMVTNWQGVPEMKARLEEFIIKWTLKMFSIITEQKAK